jgi:AraC family transcriptional regulator
MDAAKASGSAAGDASLSASTAANSDLPLQWAELSAGFDSLAQLSRSPQAHLVLAHGSLQVRVAGFAPVVANPCGVLFLNPGDRIVRIAAADENSVVDVISLAPDSAARLCRLAGLQQEKAARAGQLFGGPWARLGLDEFLRLRLLKRRRDGADYEAHLTRWVQRVLNEAMPEWRKRPTPARHGQDSADPGRFGLAQGMAAYLDASWRRNVSLAELSEVFGLTSFHLLRAFSRSIGLTPHQYTLQLRLRRSLRLIETHEGRLADVAIALGFSSHGHFSTAFRKAFGVTPADYLRPVSAPSRPAPTGPSKSQPMRPLPSSPQ